MLSRHENRFNLKILSWLSKIHFIPFSIDTEKERISHNNPKGKLLSRCNLYYLLGVIHLIYVLVRLGQSLVEREEYLFLDHFSFHVMTANFYLTGLFWHASWNYLWTEENVRNFNLIYSYGAAYSSPGPKKLREYSRMEILTVMYPLVIGSGVTGLFLILIYDPTRIQLLYFLFRSSDYENLWACLTCFGLELFTLLYMEAGTFLIFGPQMSMLQLLDDVIMSCFKDLGRLKRVKNPAVQLLTLYTKSRQLQCLIQSFNSSNRYIVFSIKLYLISTSVLLLPFATLYSSNHPFQSAFYLLISSDCFLIFIVLYGRAFFIGRDIERIKRQSINSCRKSPLLLTRNMILLGKSFRSIPKLGIRVGQFNVLERSSIPAFIGFVCLKVTRVIITLRGSDLFLNNNR